MMEPEFEFTAMLEGNKIVPHMRNEVLSLMAFLKDIDWTEPWLIGLLIFHCIVTTLTVVTRNHGNFQGAFFFSLLLLVFCSQGINEMAASNWQYFAHQQYFDSNGMFISIVFSSPILLNCLLMVGQWLWASATLMIKMKQTQLKKRLRAESRVKKQRKESETHEKDD